jgi:hypothetical protein
MPGPHTLADYVPCRYHHWTRDPARLLHEVTHALDTAGGAYALTLTSGAHLVAPLAIDTDRVWALVPAASAAGLDDIAATAGLRRVEEGETVTLFVARGRSPLLFRRRVDDYWVASDVQLYLDLWAWPRRGKEQARHLRVERLGY